MVGQTRGVQAASSAAGVTAVNDDTEHAVHSLSGEAAGLGCFPVAAGVEHGNAVGRRGVELEDVDADDDDGDGAVAVREGLGGVVAASPSWVPQGC